MTRLAGDRDEAVGAAGPAPTPFRLSRAAVELEGDLPLPVVLEVLLAQTARITGSPCGAVSLVDSGAGRYTKAAEHGVVCQVGRSFPLDEGATGRAVALRRPVVVPDYSSIASGHLPADERARHRAVVAVPVWWRGEVIAAAVAFRPHGEAFSASMVDALESVAQVAAAALLRGAEDDASTAGEVLRGIVRPVASPLTRREAEVLALVRGGRSDRQIAARLAVSPKTVEKHVGALLRKTGAANRTAAVVLAAERGWGGAG